MDREELAGKMRNRIRLCSNLADSTTDARAAVVLREMAAEAQRDLGQLQAGGSIF